MVMQIHSNYLAKGRRIFCGGARLGRGAGAGCAEKGTGGSHHSGRVYAESGPGLPFCSGFREEGYDTEVIMVISGQRLTASLNRAMKLGALDYLIKPY